MQATTASIPQQGGASCRVCTAVLARSTSWRLAYAAPQGMTEENFFRCSAR